MLQRFPDGFLRWISSLDNAHTVSACSRHSFVEGIRNGGLDVTQNRRSTLKIHYGRTKLPALQRFFSFPVWRGRIAWLIRFILGLVRLPLSAVKSSHR